MSMKPSIKGSVLYHIKQRILESFGEGKLSDVLAKCSEETRKVMNSSILSGEWYPESAMDDLATALHDSFSPQVRSIFTRELAKKQVGTVFRMFLRAFSSPNSIAERNDEVWKKIHDTGRVDVVEKGERTHTIQISGFSMGPGYAWLYIEYHAGIIEMAGAKSAKGTYKKIDDKTHRFWFGWE